MYPSRHPLVERCTRVVGAWIIGPVFSVLLHGDAPLALDVSRVATLAKDLQTGGRLREQAQLPPL